VEKDIVSKGLDGCTLSFDGGGERRGEIYKI